MSIRSSFKYQDVVRILEHYGCHLSRESKGSHRQRYSPITNQHFPVPFHWGREIREGTFFAVLKQAGISKQEVLDYLNKKK